MTRRIQRWKLERRGSTPWINVNVEASSKAMSRKEAFWAFGVTRNSVHDDMIDLVVQLEHYLASKYLHSFDDVLPRRCCTLIIQSRIWLRSGVG